MLFWVSFCADVVPHLGFRNKFCDREHLKTFRLEYCETVAIWRHQFTYTVFTSSIIWMVIKKPHFTLLIPCTLVQSAHKSIYGINKTQFLTSTGWHKKKRTFEKPNKNWRNPRKKYIDRNWTITTCLLRASNPNYQCLKITSCRWRPPPSMHSFTATTHFKSSRSFVSLCVCCMFCRMRRSRILQNIRYNHVIITCQTQDLNTRYHAIKKSDILCYYFVLFILKDHFLTARIIKHS